MSILFKGLLALHAISNGALTGTELPKRLKLLNWGQNNTRKGIVTIGPKTLSALSVNQAATGFDKIGLDYEHQSLKGHPNFKESPRAMAAYGVPVVVDGEGLFLDTIDYTPNGQENARNYHDLSPVVHQDENGEVDFIHSVALCPQGAVDGLTFFSAPDFPITKKLTAMNPELKKLLTTLFACDANATDEDILSAGKTFAEKLVKPGAGDTTAFTVEIGKLNQRLDDRERADLLAAALRDGKLVPNSAKTLPLENLKALVAELPADQVPLDKRTPDNVKALSSSISATDLIVAKQLGLKPEEMAR